MKTMLRATGLAMLVFAGMATVTSAHAAEAVLQALDKVTARVSTFTAPIDKPVRFGDLEITVRACFKRPPEDTPESSAFVKIVELGNNGANRSDVFSGWMFASSPAINPMEHPVYDVWVLDCK